VPRKFAQTLMTQTLTALVDEILGVRATGIQKYMLRF
jgi:hypothetical protein